jgi:hypothetical protein
MRNEKIIAILEPLHDRQLGCLTRYLIGGEPQDIIDVAFLQSIIDVLGGEEKLEELIEEMNQAIYDSDGIRDALALEPFVFEEKTEKLPKKRML